MSASFTPTGKAGDLGSSLAFVLENDGTTKIAIQVTMVHRKPDLDGKEELPSAEADFAVFPSQVILQAREKKTVRVSWIGKTLPTSELAYRIVAEQMDISGLNSDGKKDPDKGAKIQVLLKFQGSVYVSPPRAEAKLAVEEPKPLAEGATELIIRNEGTKHQILNHPIITFETLDRKGTFVLTEKDLAPLSGQNVLAGTRRKFVLTSPNLARIPPAGNVSSTRIEVSD